METARIIRANTESYFGTRDAFGSVVFAAVAAWLNNGPLQHLLRAIVSAVGMRCIFVFYFMLQELCLSIEFLAMQVMTVDSLLPKSKHLQQMADGCGLALAI